MDFGATVKTLSDGVLNGDPTIIGVLVALLVGILTIGKIFKASCVLLMLVFRLESAIVSHMFLPLGLLVLSNVVAILWRMYKIKSSNQCLDIFVFSHTSLPRRVKQTERCFTRWIV